MRILQAIQSAIGIVSAVLREIFDEASYARFLDRHKLASSQAAYWHFLRENESAKARRPKCC